MSVLGTVIVCALGFLALLERDMYRCFPPAYGPS